MPQPDLRQLLAVVDSPRSVDDLRSYFDTDRAAGDVPGNLGGAFELLAGGGDRPDSADRITADDLIAVQMLEVKVPTEVALHLLEGDLGRAVAAELACIPTDVAMHDPTGAELLADGGPADRAWRLLRQQHGVGWVITSKLLARKRPHLIPVYDRVVACSLGRPKQFWTWLRGMLCAEDRLLVTRLLAARDTAGVDSNVSALRILDVIVWMRHEASHSNSRCKGFAWE